MTEGAYARAGVDQQLAGDAVASLVAVLSGPAYDRLQASAFQEVIVTNTLPIPAERRFESLTVLSIAPLIARAIHEVFEDGSVTSLFAGQS